MELPDDTRSSGAGYIGKIVGGSASYRIGTNTVSSTASECVLSIMLYTVSVFTPDIKKSDGIETKIVSDEFIFGIELVPTAVLIDEKSIAKFEWKITFASTVSQAETPFGASNSHQKSG